MGVIGWLVVGAVAYLMLPRLMDKNGPARGSGPLKSEGGTLNAEGGNENFGTNLGAGPTADSSRSRSPMGGNSGQGYYIPPGASLNIATPNVNVQDTTDIAGSPDEGMSGTSDTESWGMGRYED